MSRGPDGEGVERAEDTGPGKTAGRGEAAVAVDETEAEAEIAERDEASVGRFVERFAAELADAGMQRMAARVFAALLASDDGSMTSAELAERLRISPAAVSGAIRYLSQVSMVGREREPGSRRDRYRLHDQIWFESLTRRDHLFARWRALMDEGAEALGPHTTAGVRIAETAAFFAFFQSELEQMQVRWREHRKTLDLDPKT